MLSYQYSDRGQIIRETETEGTLKSYDDYDCLLSTRNPNGEVTQYRYDDSGDLNTVRVGIVHDLIDSDFASIQQRFLDFVIIKSC